MRIIQMYLLIQSYLFKGNYLTEYIIKGKKGKNNHKNMKEEVRWRKVVRETDKGVKYIVKLPNVNEYGMVGLTNTLTMKGIAGIIPSNVFTTTYLPRKFREHSHFYATDVGQSIDSSGWKTTISGRMVWKYIKKDKKDE